MRTVFKSEAFISFMRSSNTEYTSSILNFHIIKGQILIKLTFDLWPVNGFHKSFQVFFKIFSSHGIDISCSNDHIDWTWIWRLITNWGISCVIKNTEILPFLLTLYFVFDSFDFSKVFDRQKIGSTFTILSRFGFDLSITVGGTAIFKFVDQH